MPLDADGTDLNFSLLPASAPAEDWHSTRYPTGRKAGNVGRRINSGGWRTFLDGLRPDARRELVELLRDEYLDEARDAAQFEEHARRMPDPHFRERLLRIADEERALPELAAREDPRARRRGSRRGSDDQDRAQRLGNLLMDIEEEKRDGIEALEHLCSTAERTDPEIAAGLRRMQEQERRHREEILNMLVRTDPQASSSGRVGAEAK